MIKLKKLLLPTVFAVFAVVQARGADKTINDGTYTWTYGIANGEAMVTRVSPNPSGDVQIPETIESCPVKQLGDSLFSGRSGILSVTIPSTVTIIGYRTFYNCSSLSKVTLPPSLTIIGESAFERCYALTKVTVPGSVTEIGDSAFRYCNVMESLTIASGVNRIGNSAFSYCSALTKVSIPSSVTSLGDSAFYRCSGLESLTIGSGISRVSIEAFYQCSGLKRVTIPKSVTRIDDSAFAYCRGLESVAIPSGVTRIGSSAFAGCSGLTTIYVDGGDADRVKALLESSGLKTANLSFVDGISDAVEKVPDEMARLTVETVTVGANEAAVVPVQAMKIDGIVHSGGMLFGTVQLKLGKAKTNAKTGSIGTKVSAVITGLDGKKKTSKAVETALFGDKPSEVSLAVKDWGTLVVVLGNGKFTGQLVGVRGTYDVQSAKIGGEWLGSGSVTVYAQDFSSVPGTVQTQLLPVGESFAVEKGRWTFAKAAAVSWGKNKATGVEELRVNTKYGENSNLSAVKLTYKPATGLFKGKFKLYSLLENGNKKRIKAYAVGVSGFVVGKVGFGQATIKKPACAWDVRVTR